MTPPRNELCPCGSGKKYKKCCGNISNSNHVRPDLIAVNRTMAYAGAIGEKRRTFCENYADFKTAKIHEIQDTLFRDVTSKNMTISCGQGCSTCCSQFVVASLQECDVIVYYLYQNETALQHFLKGYPAWRNNVTKIDSCFHELNQLCEKINAGKVANADLQRFTTAGRIYAGVENPCPFLLNGSCTIYEVRPFVCANYLSVTPADWCHTSHPEHNKAVHVKVTLLGKDTPYFIPVPKNRLISPTPILVHRILEEGYGAIAAITGIAELKDQVLADPAIRSALKQALSQVVRTIP